MTDEEAVAAFRAYKERRRLERALAAYAGVDGRVVQLIWAAADVLSTTPERHKRERIYETFLHPKAPQSLKESLPTIRALFGDTAESEVRTCACGQKNRINLLSTHDDDIGPKCGKCGASL